MKYIILLLISVNSYAFLEKSKKEIQREKMIATIKNKVHKKFGKFICIPMSESFDYCENKLHYCYRYRGFEKGGLDCFKHKDK